MKIKQHRMGENKTASNGSMNMYEYVHLVSRFFTCVRVCQTCMLRDVHTCRIYICVYIYMNMYTCIFRDVHTCRICIYIYMNMHTYICRICMYVCLYMDMYTYIYIYVYICICMHIVNTLDLFTYKHAYICIHMLNMYV